MGDRRDDRLKFALAVIDRLTYQDEGMVRMEKQQKQTHEDEFKTDSNRQEG